jgi:hypothetical protein
MTTDTLTDAEFARFLRSKRTMTQEEVDQAGAARDALHAIPAQSRYTACQGHHTAGPAAH